MNPYFIYWIFLPRWMVFLSMSKTLVLKVATQCRKRIPISQSGKLRLRELVESLTFTLYLAEPGSDVALLNPKTHAVFIQHRMGVPPSVA